MPQQTLPEDHDQLRIAIREKFLLGAGREGRPHQVDAVVSLVCAVRGDASAPTATNYLLQHAAGSGKSLTIAALAAALLDTVDVCGGSFHTVLVVNDRLQLDRQLGHTVMDFMTGLGYPPGTVSRANSSSQLQQYLSAPLDSSSSPKIILTTIQKLSSIWRSNKHKNTPAAAAGSNGSYGSNGSSGSNGSNGGGRVAIIADEAHRHHGNSTSEQTSAIMAAAFAGSNGSNGVVGAAGVQQQQGVASRGLGTLVQQPRFVTYFGFTATPGPRALQLFGVSEDVAVDSLGDIHTTQPQQQQQQQQQQGTEQGQQQQQQQQEEMVTQPAVLFRPFHAYSLQQATADGLVCDALQRFIAVTPRFEIEGLQLTQQQQEQLILLDAASNAAAATAANGGSAAAARKRKLLRPTAAGSSRAQPPPPSDGSNGSSNSLAAALLIQAANNSRQLVAVKAEQVVERFMEAWGLAAARGFLGFRAMLVVRSRQHVVWYCQEIRRLLLQHTARIQELLRMAGAPEDLQAAAAAGVSNMGPCCYGAFSGSIRMAAADAAALTAQGEEDDTAAAAAAATAGFRGHGGDRQGLGRANSSGNGRQGLKRKRSGSSAATAEEGQGSEGDEQQQQQRQQQRARQRGSNGWDAALAGVASADAAAAVTTQQQQQQQGQSDDSREGGSDSSSSSQSESESASESERDRGDSDRQESESESRDSLFDSSSSSDGERGEGGGGVKKGGRAPGGRDPVRAGEHLFGSVTEGSARAAAAAVAAAAGSDTDQDAADAAAATTAVAGVDGEGETRQLRKRPRRNVSRLSCNTAQTETGAAAAEDDATTQPQQQQQQSRALGRGRGSTTAAAAAAGQDDQEESEGVMCEVCVSESEINPGGVRPGDARLLVVCNKFETGYDDPRLGALFVDRVLSGARAVQVLGRINRPAPHKEGCLLVVDFVNSAGAIREAFGEYYGTTSFCTGAQAKKRRQQYALDEALNRVLEVLQPAAARAAAAAALSQQQQQQQQPGNNSTTNPSSSNSSSSHLAGMSVQQVAAVAAALPPCPHRALETDLSSYCSLCNALSMQKLEFPCTFAAALLELVTEQRQQRERLAAAAAEDGTLSDWVTSTVAASTPAADTAAAAAAATAGVTEQCSPGTAAAAAAAAAAAGEVEAAATAAEGQPGTQKPSAGSLQKQLKVSVRVCELETTFAGAVRLQNPTHLKPLTSIRLGSGRSAAAAAAAVAAAAAAAADPDSCVRLGRPLSEVIAAANAQLAGRYRKQVAAGLWELCERLKGAAAAAAPAAAALAQQPSEQAAEVNTAGPPSEPTAAAGTAGSGGAEGGNAGAAQSPTDVYSLLSLLRRMLMWPVTAELLRTTAAGKQVAALKQHPDHQVRALAEQVVQQWRASLARQAMAAAAAKARKESQKNGGKADESKLAAGKGGKGEAEGLVVDEALRGKVVGMMREALVEHRKAVMAAEQQQQQQQGSNSSSSKGKQTDKQQQQQLQAERPALEQLAERLEAAVQRYLQQQAQTGAAAAAGAAASGAAAAGVTAAASPAALLQSYKSRVRMLCTGLRYPDGVSADLIAGQRSADEVAALDALGLAPAAVQAAEQRRREAQARGEAVWESLMSESVGGGGTFLSTEITCPSCGEKRAQVHTILSGGTYAQERVQIQKYVCQGCQHTWRSDE